MSEPGIEIDSDLDLEARVLCPDGNCVGVVGEDRRCRVCGTAYDGELPEKIPAADSDGEDDAAIEAHASASADGDTADLEERELCPDGSCIGVLGPEGRCKVCERAR